MSSVAFQWVQFQDSRGHSNGRPAFQLAAYSSSPQSHLAPAKNRVLTFPP